MPPSLTVESTPSTVLVQHKGFAPVLNRAWASPIDAAAGISSWASADGQLLVLRVVKGQPGRRWSCCFKVREHVCMSVCHSVTCRLPRHAHVCGCSLTLKTAAGNRACG